MKPMDKKQTRIIFQETGKFNKPNVLINVAKSKELSLKDKKVYNVLLRMLIDQELVDFQNNLVKTSVSQIAYMLNIKNRMDIHDILDKLSDTRITFNHLVDNKEVETSTRLIASRTIFREDMNSLIIEFSSMLTKEILLGHQRYTKLDLIEINKLKVSHSLTIYELIKSKLYKYKYQYQNYTEKELRRYLHLEDKYLDIKSFNQMVVRKSLKDINENTELDLTLLKVSKDKEGARTYHLQVKLDEFNISSQTFRNTLRELVSKGKEITFKHRKNIYVLATNGDFGNEKDVEKLYWLNNNSGKTVSTDLAIFIWDELFSQYQKDWYSFIEDKLGIDINDWINTERHHI